METRRLGLGGKFLWLTVPVFLVSAGLLLAFLLVRRDTELRDLAVVEARLQLERDAGLLSLPLWNLDYRAVEAIAASAVDGGRARCVRVDEILGQRQSAGFGQCEDATGLVHVEATVLAPGGRDAIGSLHHWVDVAVPGNRLFVEMQPVLMMFVLLVLALVACVAFAFRRLIVLPLRLAQLSIHAYRENRQRVPVPYASADELGDFVSEFNDGQARQEAAERELRAQLGVQSALNRTLPLPMAVVDAEFRMSGCNPAFGRQIAACDCRGEAVSSLVERLDLDRLRESVADVVAEQQVVVPARDGHRRTFRVLSAHLPQEAGDGWLLVFQDLTDDIESARALNAAFAATRETLRELQQAQQSLVQAEKLASLGSVVAGIAHEVNTPVGSSLTVASSLAAKVQEFNARVAAGSLRRSDLSTFVAEVGEAAEILQRGLGRAAEQIARFKQVAADQTSSQRRGFDLATLVEEVLSLLRPTLRRGNAELLIEVAPGLDLDGYPGPLGQVLTNLVTNALRHGLDGRRQGKIHVRGSAIDADHVRLEVEDDGVGIAPEHLDRVFDPFFTTKMGSGGTGLGLNLVYTMVSNLLGGTIAVRSAQGQGTVFVIELPRVAPVAEAAAGNAS